MKNDRRVRHKGVACEKVTSGRRRRGGRGDESVLLMELLFPPETEGQTERLKTVTTRQMLTDVLKELEFKVCGPALFTMRKPLLTNRKTGQLGHKRKKDQLRRQSVRLLQSSEFTAELSVPPHAPLSVEEKHI